MGTELRHVSGEEVQAMSVQVQMHKTKKEKEKAAKIKENLLSDRAIGILTMVAFGVWVVIIFIVGRF